MNRFDIKYKLGRHLPVSFRDAVLDGFTVEQEDDRVIVRISYYHLKAKTTINIQMMILTRELDYLGNSFLKEVGRQCLRSLKREAKKVQPLQHIKVNLTVQND
jgi:hypothetical protein